MQGVQQALMGIANMSPIENTMSAIINMTLSLAASPLSVSPPTTCRPSRRHCTRAALIADTAVTGSFASNVT